MEAAFDKTNQLTAQNSGPDGRGLTILVNWQKFLAHLPGKKRDTGWREDSQEPRCPSPLPEKELPLTNN
jgi:hypothetical protein